MNTTAQEEEEKERYLFCFPFPCSFLRRIPLATLCMRWSEQCRSSPKQISTRSFVRTLATRFSIPQWSPKHGQGNGNKKEHENGNAASFSRKSYPSCLVYLGNTVVFVVVCGRIPKSSNAKSPHSRNPPQVVLLPPRRRLPHSKRHHQLQEKFRIVFLEMFRRKRTWVWVARRFLRRRWSSRRRSSPTFRKDSRGFRFVSFSCSLKQMKITRNGLFDKDFILASWECSVVLTMVYEIA